MKIAILTSGILPVPAVQGGAVENLTDFYLEYNNQHKLHDITIYSIWHSNVEKHPALRSNVNHYVYIKTNRFIDKIHKYIFKLTHKELYYHYSIEYYLKKTLQFLHKRQYDLIIIENRPGYVLELTTFTKTKLVVHQGNNFLNINTKNAKEIYNASSIIINTSNYLTKQVKSINSQDKKCFTVYNGIDTEYFYRAEKYKRTILNIKDDDFIIAYSGRLNEDKGVMELVEAFKLINIPNSRLLIIGASFYGKDKTTDPFIQQLTQEVSPIKNQVIFTGFIDYHEIPSYLKMADIAVVPSKWDEPFGLTVVEAMAAGLPLITTKSGGIPEICTKTAIIVERENLVDNLATAIRDLYQHPEKRKALGQAGLMRSKYFDKERFAKDFFKAIQTI